MCWVGVSFLRMGSIWFDFFGIKCANHIMSIPCLSIGEFMFSGLSCHTHISSCRLHEFLSCCGYSLNWCDCDFYEGLWRLFLWISWPFLSVSWLFSLLLYFFLVFVVLFVLMLVCLKPFQQILVFWSVQPFFI